MPEARTPARPDEPDVGEFVRTCIPIGNVSRHMCDLAGPSWPILVLESHMAIGSWRSEQARVLLSSCLAGRSRPGSRVLLDVVATEPPSAPDPERWDLLEPGELGGSDLG